MACAHVCLKTLVELGGGECGCGDAHVVVGGVW